MSKRDLGAAYTAVRTSLLAARKAAGLSQAEVAKKLGRPQQFVSKYETGERRIDVVELLLLAEILELDAPELVASIRSQLRSRQGRGQVG